MSKSSLPVLFAASGLLFLWPLLTAENWPQWRGPRSQGVSSETGLPVHWSTGKNLAWKSPLAGAGVSSPVVWGDRVIVTSQAGRAHGARNSFPLLARDDSTLAERENPIQGARSTSGTEDKEVFLIVEAFRRSDGSRLWEYRVRATGEFPDLHEKHNLATPTPIVDGERIYAWFGNGQLVALDLDGRVVWTRHLGVEISPFRNSWGHGSSPALYGDMLILLCDHQPRSYLLALDRRTGKQRWLVDRGQGRVSHSTPLVAPGPLGDELIVNSSERIDAYNPVTGKLIWHAGSERQTPIVTGPNRFFISAGYGHGAAAAELQRTGEKYTARTIWQNMRMKNKFNPSVLYEGHIYGLDEGILACLDAETGQQKWKGGRYGFGQLLLASGHLIVTTEFGDVVLVKATHERHEEVTRFSALDGKTWNVPALAGGRLFVRNTTEMACFRIVND